MTDLNVVTHTVRNGDVVMPVLDVGQGPVVLLLHGFPDSRHVWRHQVPALVGAGLRVIAPDLRGFGDASRPASVKAYRLTAVTQDVVGILDTLEIARAAIVGHDWGAAVGWLLAAYHAAHVERLAALGVGCPGTSGLRTIEQRERFCYFYFFQFTGVEGHPRNSYEKVAGTWRYERLHGASHWMMLDRPDELNRLLLAFLCVSEIPAASPRTAREHNNEQPPSWASLA